MTTNWKNIIIFGIKLGQILKKIDSEPICNKKVLKTKIKSQGDEATDVHDEEIPKAGSDCICAAVITIDSALKRDENHYLYVFLNECKYIKKEVIRHITKNIEGFSKDSNEQQIKSKYRDVFVRIPET